MVVVKSVQLLFGNWRHFSLFYFVGYYLAKCLYLLHLINFVHFFYLKRDIRVFQDTGHLGKKTITLNKVAGVVAGIQLPHFAKTHYLK